MTTQSRLIVGSCDDSFEDSGKRKEATGCVCGPVQGQRVGGSATFASVHYEITYYNRPKTGQVLHETSQHALQVIRRSLINTFNGCLTAPTFKSNVFISNNSRAYTPPSQHFATKIGNGSVGKGGRLSVNLWLLPPPSTFGHIIITSL